MVCLRVCRSWLISAVATAHGWSCILGLRQWVRRHARSAVAVAWIRHAFAQPSGHDLAVSHACIHVYRHGAGPRGLAPLPITLLHSHWNSALFTLLSSYACPNCPQIMHFEIRSSDLPSNDNDQMERNKMVTDVRCLTLFNTSRRKDCSPYHPERCSYSP